MAEHSLAAQTMFAELLQRCLDAEFDLMYGERGRFVTLPRAHVLAHLTCYQRRWR